MILSRLSFNLYLSKLRKLWRQKRTRSRALTHTPWDCARFIFMTNARFEVSHVYYLFWCVCVGCYGSMLPVYLCSSLSLCVCLSLGFLRQIGIGLEQLRPRPTQSAQIFYPHQYILCSRPNLLCRWRASNSADHICEQFCWNEIMIKSHSDDLNIFDSSFLARRNIVVSTDLQRNWINFRHAQHKGGWHTVYLAMTDSQDWRIWLETSIRQ